MTRGHNQNNPLRTEGPCIEKPKGPWKSFQDLPAWYHRLLHKVIDHDMNYDGMRYSGDPVGDDDFEEDLSDLDKEDDEDTPDSAPESQARAG